jgi:cation transporter-like permease
MAPGFGEIDPDNVTEDPTATELGDAVKVILVGGLVNVVKVVDVEMLVDV